MRFTKEFLTQDLYGTAVIENVAVSKRRWYSIHRVVFKYEGKFYVAFPRVPASELQEDIEPYEDDEIECPEVFPVQKTITVYEEKVNAITGDLGGRAE